MKPQFKHPNTTKEGRIERAVAVLNAPGGFVQDKQAFLKSKGVSDSEFLEALNIATSGELLWAAGN